MAVRLQDREAEVTVIELPFPPAQNNLFINLRKGRARSQRYDQWIQEAGWELQRQRPPVILGSVVVKYTFNPPDKRRRDLSGLVKAPEDLLVSHGVIEADDTRIVRSFSTHISESVTGVKIEITSV